MFFTQQTSCLPYVSLTYFSWYIGIYTVNTLLYSLYFTNCIIPFLPLLSIHPWVFTWVLQPELLLKVVTSPPYSPFLKLSLLFDHLSSTYLFSAQLWDISEIFYTFICLVLLKRAKGTISLAQAKDVVLGPNCILKSLWRWIKNEGIKKRI